MILNIFNRSKNKQVEVKLENADDITDLLAEKINAKNDEVMLLTQENEKLGYELNKLGEELRMSESENKTWEEFSYKQAENLQAKVMENTKLNSELTRIKNNFDELSKKKPDKKLKERNKELEEMLSNSESLIKNNTIYRKTYEYISDERNRQTIIDNFSHNLSKWISEKGLTDTEVAKKLDTSRNIVGNLRTGKRAVNVNTIQKFDIELCEYFECSVYELVTVKMEGKKC